MFSRIYVRAALSAGLAVLSMLFLICVGQAEVLTDGPARLTTVRGPQAAKGVIYFVFGNNPEKAISDDYHFVPYFLVSLAQEQGWDVITGKLPVPGFFSGTPTHEQVADYIAEKSRSLRAQGYKRVIVGGQSFGAWMSLLASGTGKLDADAILATAPATWGSKTRNGQPNPYFERNRTEYFKALANVRTPAAVIFFDGDIFDPGGRGPMTASILSGNKVPYLLIDHPKAFSGHGSAWLMPFSYEYTACIDRFLSTSRSEHCGLRPLSNKDFRSVVASKQVPDMDKRRMSDADWKNLIGHNLVLYSDLGGAIEVKVRDNKNMSLNFGDEVIPITYTYDQNGLCDSFTKSCADTVWWDKGRFTGFNKKSGTAYYWGFVQ